MKKILICICLILLSFQNVRATDFVGKSYVVIDGVTGSIIESQNENYVQSVASISKIMTAIVAIENGKLDDEYVIGEEVNKAYGSGVYIHIGDTITLQDLLYGLLLRSGNDAALCIAKNIGGEVETFVEMMNSKANELKLTNTHFSNPTGLDEEDDGNQSSALDMARLMKYCSENPIFNDIVSTYEYKRLDNNGTWHNKNKLLKQYKYCVGGKTGFTKKAKRTLVTRAIKNGVPLIIVTFNCGNDFEFHKDKYEQCFKKLSKNILIRKGIYNHNGHSFLIDHDIYSLVDKDTEVSFIDNNQYIHVVVNENTIGYYKKEDSIVVILKYWFILLGEFVNG
jgi:D-alanyl-D-alanine carboxypeptidase